MDSKWYAHHETCSQISHMYLDPHKSKGTTIIVLNIFNKDQNAR